jgi:protein-S-isoprenylcysteine O-methyltransferase Ste14
VRPLYESDQLARTLYYALTVVWVAFELSYFVRFVGRPGSRRQDRLSGPALLAGLLLALNAGAGVAHALPQTTIAWNRPYVFALGLALGAAGVAFRWYAIKTLGRFFTMRVTTTADQSVVDTGPYRLIRHPSYTGSLMTVLGVLLCMTNWLSLVCLLVAVPGFAYRMKVEEQALLVALGEPYLVYMRRTKRLIPYLL